MSRVPVWSICDRCGFQYYLHTMKRESTGLYVCTHCNDGKWDRNRHAQNFPALNRREMVPRQGARPPIDLTGFLATENYAFLTTEDGEFILV